MSTTETPVEKPSFSAARRIADKSKAARRLADEKIPTEPPEKKIKSNDANPNDDKAKAVELKVIDLVNEKKPWRERPDRSCFDSDCEDCAEAERANWWKTNNSDAQLRHVARE